MEKVQSLVLHNYAQPVAVAAVAIVHVVGRKSVASGPFLSVENQQRLRYFEPCKGSMFFKTLNIKKSQETKTVKPVKKS